MPSTKDQDQLRITVERFVKFLEGEISPQEYFQDKPNLDAAMALYGNAHYYTFDRKRGSEQVVDFYLDHTRSVDVLGPEIWCTRKYVHARHNSQRIKARYHDHIGLFPFMVEVGSRK